jgi:hypothetical protein
MLEIEDHFFLTPVYKYLSRDHSYIHKYLFWPKMVLALQVGDHFFLNLNPEFWVENEALYSSYMHTVTSLPSSLISVAIRTFVC